MNISPQGITDTHLQELFDLYVITTGVRDHMLGGKWSEIATGQFGDLLGAISVTSVTVAKLMNHIRDLQRFHPAIYETWCEAIRAARQDAIPHIPADIVTAESSRISAEALAEMRRIAGLHAGAYGDAMLTLAEGMERWARQPKEPTNWKRQETDTHDEH